MKRTPSVERFGFTLVEMITVVAVVGILMVLIIPAINSARLAGKRAQALGNLKTLAGMFEDYLVDHDDHYPTVLNPMWPFQIMANNGSSLSDVVERAKVDDSGLRGPDGAVSLDAYGAVPPADELPPIIDDNPEEYWGTPPVIPIEGVREFSDLDKLDRDVITKILRGTAFVSPAIDEKVLKKLGLMDSSYRQAFSMNRHLPHTRGNEVTKEDLEEIPMRSTFVARPSEACLLLNNIGISGHYLNAERIRWGAEAYGGKNPILFVDSHAAALDVKDIPLTTGTKEFDSFWRGR